MSDLTVVSLADAKNSDLAILKAKAADLKIELHAKFQGLCALLDKMNEAGISVDFSFGKQPGQPWQVISKVYKEL
jgi:hypothetical protein